MKWFFIVGLCVWVLLLPSLCLAGSLQHTCSNCPQGVVCSHEERCVDDPCLDDLVRPESAPEDARFVPAPLELPPGLLAERSFLLGRDVLLMGLLRNTALGLPVHESDLPLLA